MTILIQSNKGKTIQHPYNNKITQQERIIVFGAIADIAYIPMHSLLKIGYNFGPTFQAGPTGTISIALTCDPEDQAILPANDSQIAWYAWQAPLAANTMVTVGMLIFTVAKLTFNGADNRCMICSL